MDISQSEIATIMSGASIEGSSGVTITLVEYSDMECPFCVRLHNDIQLWKQIHIKYGNSVNYVFKNNRGVNHPNTERKALSALCIKKLGGDSLYIKFYNEVLSLSSLKLYPTTRIPAFLRKNKISTPKFNACVKDPATLSQLDSETKEAQKYNLGGTPGVIILNNKTLKYDIVEGAYPIEKFVETIDSLLR
ncbi:thioredoxin domain-containing protein [Candidatus Gracilibacteria bacterium]|nr:thioredoxin domain-containing protein [Candidatus Gracilibacteria bacterium]